MRKAFVRILGLAVALGMAAPAPASEEVELVQLMSSLQYFAHKAGLAIDGQNRPLARFYVHEIEEVLEEVEEVESFDGHPIGELAGSLIMPALEHLEETAEDGDWRDLSASFDDLLEACNGCHQATDHAYIRIERRRDNPYMQAFGATD